MNKFVRGMCLFVVVMAIITSCAEHKTDAYFKERAFKLTSPHGSCSGEQVEAPSGQTYILTAAHCKILANENGSITVTRHDGSQLERKVVAEDSYSDLLLLEGVPGLSGLEIASFMTNGEAVTTFTNGKGHDTYRTDGYALESKEIEVALQVTQDEIQGCDKPKNKLLSLDTIFGHINACLLSITETVITAPIVPGSSGGMVVDSSGQLVGVVSAGDGVFGYMNTTWEIRHFLQGY